jgi:hypothetical protein
LLFYICKILLKFNWVCIKLILIRHHCLGSLLSTWFIGG